MKVWPHLLCLTLLVVGWPSGSASASDQLSLPATIAAGAEYGADVAFLSEVAPVAYACCEPSCDSGCGEQCGCCDTCGSCGAKKKAKANPCAASHKGVFYANDFSYLKDPCYNGCCLGDCLKLMDAPVGKLDVGGQLRLRYHHEEGMDRVANPTPPPAVAPGFNDTSNDFLLTRLRLYANWKVCDWCRVYAEGISADVTANDAYIPRGIDRNSGDILNLFVDLGLTESTTLRVGRQELLYGTQRHVSPLDWSNTRRTFEGVKLMYKSGDWAIDSFYTNFVPVQADDFDQADYDQSFYGVYATNTASKALSYDLFYLGFDNQNPQAAVPNTYSGSAGTNDFSIHTFGTRLFGGSGDWVWEVEAAYQTGRQSGLGLDHSAGMCTGGIGRKLDMDWSPTVWMYYDWASGNDFPQDGDFNRYNQLFPLAHKYLGFIDAVARANISTPNCLVTLAPSQRLSLLCWYYYFSADQAEDIIPGVGFGSAQRVDSKDFGNELDLLARYQLSPRSNILFGYSNLWRGTKVIGNSDAHFFYSQWELNF